MILYTVKSGESLVEIASKFKVSVKRLASDNDILPNVPLTEGQEIVVRTPVSLYTASSGDTVWGLCESFSIDHSKLLQMNPELMKTDNLKNGTDIVLDNGPREYGPMKVMASLRALSDVSSAERIMPYLTYLSIRACALRSDGSLYTQNARELFHLAKKYRVMPIMEIQRAFNLDNNEKDVMNEIDGIQRMARNVKETALSNGYGGINFNLGNIREGLFDNYVELVSTVKSMVQPWDIKIIATLPENVVLSSDVEMLADAADIITILPKSPKRDITDVLEIEDLLRLLCEVTDGSKISLCAPMSAIDRMFGKEGECLREEKFSSAQASRLACERGSAITYDESRCLSEYEYLDIEFGSLVTHRVEFEGVESLYEILCIAREYKIEMLNVFNADKYYAPFWSMLSDLYDIEKIK